MGDSVGIYVHIPFCKRKCDYCDFYSLSGCSQKFMDEYIKALVKQLDDYTLGGSKYTVDTIYIGGGTPSFFGGKRIKTLLSEIEKRFALTKNVEVTVEVNPESADKGLFKTLKKAGVNRISMGVQSSNDEDLSRLGRLHNFEGAKTAVELCSKYCTDNISLDLMYGLEGQSVDGFKKAILDIVALKPKHISCYALSVEGGTPLAVRNPVLPDDDTVADMYFAAVETLENAGYLQYEISNFSLPGYRSRHNSRYWDLSPYIGIGAAAHSFFGDKRFSVIKDAEEYIKRLETGESVIDEADEVAIKNRIGEYVMLKLRTSDGIDEGEFSRRFKTDFEPYAEKLRSFEKDGFTETGGGIYKLTPKGFFVSNTIISEVLDVI